MKQSAGALDFIDLNFLSAEEEAAIRRVLLRDEDLKRLETGRVRKLRQSVPDLTQLKTLSGEWFEELRAKRYGQQTDVTAVVRSSMRLNKTAAHKTNPFLKDIVEENKEGEKETRTSSDASTDSRLIHPALNKESCRQYTDEDFLEDGLAGNSSSEKLKASIDHKSDFNNTHLRNGSTEAQYKDVSQHKDVSGDDTTTQFELSNAVDVQPESSEGSATKHATTNAEPRRKISLPPALQKDQSSEETWVKTSLAKPKKPQDTSSLAGPKAEVNTHDETLMKKDLSDQEEEDNFREGFGINMESSSLNFVDQTITYQIVSKKTPLVEPISSSQSHVPPVEAGDKTNISRCLDLEGSEVTESDVSHGSTAGNKQNIKTFTESWTETLVISNSANEHDKSKPVFRDGLNDGASLDRKRGERKNVSAGMLAETDTEKVFLRDSGEKQINKRSTVEEEPKSRSLKKGIGTESDEIPSESLQGENDFLDFKPDHQAEMGMKKSSNIQVELLLPKTAQSETEPHVSDRSVKKDLEAYKDEEEIKMKPSALHDLDLPEDIYRPSHGLAELSKEHVSVRDDGKLVHSGNVTLHGEAKQDDRTDSKTIQPAKSSQASSEDIVGPHYVLNQPQGSSEIQDVEENQEADQRTGSNILLNVLARAQRARPPVLQKTTEELKQESRDATVPTIVIMPSESPEPTEGNKHGPFVLEASAKGSETPSYTTDSWEDEGVDSDDDDDTSVSSYGSDLSGRKGHSASVLSLTDRTGSLLSVYSEAGDFGNVQVRGSVEFALMYSPVGELIVMIEQCQDLAIANPRKHRTDPYVKTYLYPDKSRRSKRKTSIKKHTLNPVYVESLRYKVTREELPGKTLNLSVWHNDSRGRNVFLGQVEISLKTWDWRHEALTWYNLQPKTSDSPESQEPHGSLSVSLKYVPPEATGDSKKSSGKIHIWLREAKALRRLKSQEVDSFVKCNILPDMRKKSRQKTRVIKKTQDPVYNHTMVYDGFKPGEVSEACCELSVWDHNTLSNQFLGGVRLSLGAGRSYGKNVDWMDSTNEEVQIWKKMLDNPNVWIDGDLPLRSSMTPRK